MTTPLPSTAPAIRWGILAPGGICKAFANAVNVHTQSSIVAVGSRSLERAQAFADEFQGGTAYGSYEELVADPNVDAIYIASPHSHHRDHALLAIEAGKHVLVEKAFALNVSQAREIVAAARAKGVFCMEAMWTRHLPHVIELRDVIARGDIGDVVSIQADHGQQLTHVERLMNPELAGGTLLDLGVYPISFAYDILGVPDSVTSVGQLTETGVDGQVSVILNYGPRAQATLHTTLWAQTPTTAVIAGTEGRIEVAGDFYRPTSFTVKRKDGTSWTFDGDFPNGYAFEAAEVANRIAAGDTESPRMTLDHSLDVMAIMDEVRAQIGLTYPGE
ncbi:MAG: oxidoreductase [Actinobacteria bacterium HGW-Actinobacteria-4]|nr:MAG: oxidoreductase [Actinobacteria bacterium HGW-Actinobacteria-4]